MMDNVTGWGPYQTPGIIKKLIISTCLIAIFAALLNPLFVKIFALPGPVQLLTLSQQGLSQYYFWQLVSYLFVQDGASEGISLTFLMFLAFNMYVLWVLGSMVQERMGNRLFSVFYLGIGACVGAITVGVASLLGQPIYLAGATAPLLALLVCWGMYYPNSQLQLFFLIPVQTKWVVATVAAIICVLSLGQLDFVSFVFYLFSMLAGYLFSGLILGLSSPFAYLHPVDEILEKGHDWLFGKVKEKSSKIIPLDGSLQQEDEAFIDAMLAKISQHGEHSLTPKEQERMRIISERKRKR